MYAAAAGEIREILGRNSPQTGYATTDAAANHNHRTADKPDPGRNLKTLPAVGTEFPGFLGRGWCSDAGEL